MRRAWLLLFALALVIAGCGLTSEVEDEGVTDTSAAAEILEGEEIDTTTTLDSDEEDDDGGVLEIATLLPIESGRYEGEQWIKWKLTGPIPDPADPYVRTYQLNIRSLEDDVFGMGFTLSQGEEPFATGFCLADRPNCANETFDVAVDIGPEGDELIFRVPEGTYGDATGLMIGAYIQTWATEDADLVTDDITGGSSVPMGFDERDPC